MQFMKKYINLNLFFVMSLFLYSMPVMSAEFSLGDFDLKEVSQEAVQTTKALSETLSEIVADNSIIMPVAGVAVVTGLIFCGRKQISNGITKQINAVEPFIKKQYEELEAQIKKECEESVKKFEESSFANRCLLQVLSSSLAGLNYMKYNQWYMGVAAVFCSLAKVAGHPYWGAGIGTAVLIKGWNKQDFAEMHGRFDQTDAKVEAAKIENARLHTEAKIKLSTIESDIANLSGDLKKTGINIATQMSDLKVQVSYDIKVVGGNLTALDEKLKNVPAQILKMARDLKDAQAELKEIKGSNAEIMQQNNAIVAKTEALSEQLTNATQEFVSTKKQFDTLGEKLTAQVKQLAEDTRNQLDAIEDCSEKQIAEIKGLKAEAKKNFENLFERVKESSLLLKTFKDIQESHDSKLSELMAQLSENQGFNENTLNIINQLAKSQEESANQYNKMAAELVDMNTANTKAFGLINSNVTKLNQAYLELKNRMEKIEEAVQANELSRKKDQEEIIHKISKNHSAVEKRIEDSDELNKKNYEDLGKKLEEQKALLNMLFKQNVERQEENKALKKELKGVKKELQDQKNIAMDTNQYVRETHGMAMNVTGQRHLQHDTGYPLSVPIHPFPSGKKILPHPKSHVRQPSSGPLGLPGINFTNPKK